MAWTGERVEKLLSEVSALRDCRTARESAALEGCARLEAERRRHSEKAAELVRRAAAMEALMRRLLDERTRLAEEVAALRRGGECRTPATPPAEEREEGATHIRVESWTAPQVRDTFDSVPAPHFGAGDVELRVPCAVAAHRVSVALALPPSLSSAAVSAAVRGALRGAGTTQGALPPLELRALGDGHFAFHCAAVAETASALMVLHVNASVVSRIGFAAAGAAQPRVSVAQVDAQESCADHVVLNAALERNTQKAVAAQTAAIQNAFAEHCMRYAECMADATTARVNLFLSSAFSFVPLLSLAAAAGTSAAAHAAVAEAHAFALAETFSDLCAARVRFSAAEAAALRGDLCQCAAAFEVLRREVTAKNAQLEESKRYCCAVDAELERSAAALAEVRVAIGNRCGGER